MGVRKLVFFALLGLVVATSALAAPLSEAADIVLEPNVEVERSVRSY
jgi:hypothetical protein